VRKSREYYPQEMTDICVVKRDGESVEDLIKRFKKKFSKSGVIKDLKEKMYYEKPSDRKRRKRSQAKRLREKEELKVKNYKERNLKYKKKQEGGFDKDE
jgi:small subunit ribosomal protein S21